MRHGLEPETAIDPCPARVTSAWLNLAWQTLMPGGSVLAKLAITVAKPTVEDVLTVWMSTSHDVATVLSASSSCCISVPNTTVRCMPSCSLTALSGMHDLCKQAGTQPEASDHPSALRSSGLLPVRSSCYGARWQLSNNTV
jgi:hypothetical protein